MSRESDIKALKQLKQDMDEANAFADLANEEWERARQIKTELETTQFVFKPLSTNNEETAKAKFVSAWKEKFGKPVKFKLIYLIIYSLLVAALSVVLFMDFTGQRGWLYVDTAYLHAEESFLDFLLIYAGKTAFFLSVLLLPWVIIKSKLPDFIQGLQILAIGGYVVGGLIYWYVAHFTKSMFLLFTYLALPVAAILIGLLIHLVCLIISKFPAFSKKQKDILAAERKKDAENTQSNAVNEEKERAEWESWWAQKKAELKEEALNCIAKGDTAMDTAKAHLAAAEASDILGENEKSGEIIDLLVYFIESRRADSIKEALHEYDNMQQNKKLLEIEAMKVQVEIEKAKKENADRQRELEMQRRHQIEMEAQARRNADLQSQIAASTAAAAASAERMRRDAASAAADAAAAQAQLSSDIAAIRRDNYYNS